MIFQNGNKYTTRLIITELKKSDRDQTGTVYVHNQRGGANYTYTLSNLEGELNFFISYSLGSTDPFKNRGYYFGDLIRCLK